MHDGRRKLNNSRPKASVKRMGRMVNVYRKESKHTAKPNIMIYGNFESRYREAVRMPRTFSIAMGILRKLLTRSHFSSW